MKKSLIFVGMLAIGFANAQEGNVGINTDQPKATLDIQPNATNLAGTTNEGILAPRLSKTRIANIEVSKLTEGTLVYATDDTTSPISAYTGADTKVAKITEKGYYFYNGTEWVKAGVGANEELWATRPNDEDPSITETYLKPANDKSDFVGYRSDRKWLINIGEAREDDFKWGNGAVGYAFKDIPASQLITSDAFLKRGNVGTNGNYFYFSAKNNLLKESHVSANPTGRYTGHSTSLFAKNVTSPIASITGSVSSATLFSNTKAASVIGISTNIAVGDDNKEFSNAVATDATAGYFNARNFATTTNLFGIRTYTNNYGTATNLRGAQINTNSQVAVEGTIAPHTVRTLIGTQNIANLNDNATITNGLMTSYNELNIGNNTTIDDAVSIRGLYSRIAIQPTTAPINSRIVNYISVFRPTGTTISRYADYGVYPNLQSGASVTEYVGYDFNQGSMADDATIENMYGLKMGSITKGSASNYAIHTEKGKVRFGELTGSGDRPVYVDSDGVLKVGSAVSTKASEVASTNAMECNAENRGKMNFIQGEDGKSDVFGICMKNKNGNYYWGYMVGGNNPTNGTGAFGSGL